MLDNCFMIVVTDDDRTRQCGSPNGWDVALLERSRLRRGYIAVHDKAGPWCRTHSRAAAEEMNAWAEALRRMPKPIHAAVRIA